MAVCKHCDQEMTGGVPCVATPVPLKTDWQTGDHFDPPRVVQPVRYGDETRGGRDAPCHDCGTPPGGFHHPGCDWEECPACHGQIISCGCLDEPEEDEE